MEVSVAEIKANLSAILKRAAEGERIVITKHGKPYVTLSKGVERATLPRVGAFKQSKFWISDDFDELGPEWDEYTKS